MFACFFHVFTVPDICDNFCMLYATVKYNFYDATVKYRFRRARRRSRRRSRRRRTTLEKREKGTGRREGGEGGRPDIGSRPGSELEGEVGGRGGRPRSS